MGAFFLFRSERSLDVRGARKVFDDKGFSPPVEFQLADRTLLLYRKMAMGTDNFCSDDAGATVFCCGTIAYRGLGYRASLARLLADFRAESIDRERLQGNFCVWFWDGRSITLMADAQNAQHVFIDESGDVLSSSFLAVVASSPAPRRLHRLAAMEKLATGCLVGPETLVEGIHQADFARLESLPGKTGIQIVPQGRFPVAREFHRAGLEDSVRRQADVLQRYFAGIQALHKEQSGELGLSSGYDSRLLLALARSFGAPIPLHTHCSGTAHDEEIRIVEMLARQGNHPLTKVPTRQMETLEEERFSEVLRDNLYFFDGRCCNDMGSYSETYTAGYRKKVLGPNRLSYSGLGGEIFRNGFGTPGHGFSWSAWLDCMVFYPFAQEAAGHAEGMEQLHRSIDRKVALRLGIEWPRRADRFLTRAYYAAVRMPDCASNVANAYGQVAFVLTPFIERPIAGEALQGDPYIGTGGAYEAAIINQIAPEIAAVESHYGFPFSRVPARHLFQTGLRSWTPMGLRRRRVRWLNRNEEVNPEWRRYGERLATSLSLRDIHAVLHEVFPDADWSVAMRHFAQRWTAISVGSFLKEFQSKLRW
jgi:hypothetical protein